MDNKDASKCSLQPNTSNDFYTSASAAPIAVETRSTVINLNDVVEELEKPEEPGRAACSRCGNKMTRHFIFVNLCLGAIVVLLMIATITGFVKLVTLNQSVEDLEFTVKTLTSRLDSLEKADTDPGSDNILATQQQHDKPKDNVAKRTPVIVFTATDVESSVEADETVIFTKLFVSQGGGYSTQSGEFQAPVTGFYSVTLRIHAGDRGAIVFLKHNDKEIADTSVSASSDKAAVTTLAIRLEKADTLYAVSNSRSSFKVFGNYFSVHLIAE